MDTKLSPELLSLLEVQSAPFVLIDEQYQIVGANQAYCENYGISQQEIVGKHCYEVSHRSDVPCHQHGEDCPHQAVFSTAKQHEVIHTHFDRHHRPEYARIKGHPIMGEVGVRYLGELIVPIANPDELNCDEMRMVGHSPAFLHCVEMLARVAESEASVLLLGESGVGKELAAQYLHKRSSRHDKPFVAINCAAITETMFEDELFGHERGAFTGCIGRKQGLFELAHGGTLFLDEAGEIPLTMQAKLLRVLESGEYRRMGGTETLTADVRIVAATNRNLLDMAETGQYRLDLYYRIAGIDLRLPSLRERRIDIPALAETMLKRITEAGAPRCKLTDRALDKLMAYDFPGNVRELRNILLRAVAICNNSVIDAEQIVLGSSLNNAPQIDASPVLPNSGTVQEMQKVVAGIPITQLEADYIAELLKIHHGHRRNVADILGMSERTLYRKLKQYGLS
ncbi:sigma-54 interaction domain-containing protein [Sulfuriferula nivalis]|uniref:Transcriptional regulator n=1 Tax=Sulfuriferula nivalis TaxID=2675298 RepID=A0A809RMY0_9PROT|nr:sigma 54-interacting transcriptional regulator [Sulfuriferula nivalis]BBP00151.1 transcriptional regulator [Sulfuriferula nivalis]